MIYELFGFTAYEIARHERNELGDGNFGFVSTLEDVDEKVCACFSLVSRFPCLFIPRLHNKRNPN